MSCLEFISSIVASTAWPAVLLVIFLCIRKKLLEAIPRLLRFKYKDLEAEFDKELDRTKSDVLVAGLDDNRDSDIVKDVRENLRAIAKISPNAAITESFKGIELAAKNLISRNGENPNYKIASPYKLIEKILDESNSTGKMEVAIFRDLRILRNQVVHSNLIATEKQAHEYIDLAALLIAKLSDQDPD